MISSQPSNSEPHSGQDDSENVLRNIADALPQLVWIADSDGVVSYYSDRVAEYKGAVKHSDGRWSWNGLLHPEDKKATEHAWAKAVATGSIYEKEHRVLMKDDTYRWHLSRAIPEKDKAGKVVKWFGTATDIHTLKAAEEKLEFASILTQNIADAVIGTDTEYKVISWNKGAEELYGFKEDEVIGRPAAEVLKTEFLSPEDKKAWPESLSKNNSWRGEVIQYTRDGSKVNVLASIANVVDNNGITIGAVAVNRNITERKKRNWR